MNKSHIIYFITLIHIFLLTFGFMIFIYPQNPKNSMSSLNLSSANEVKASGDISNYTLTKEDLEEFIDGFMEDHLETYKIPGASIAVVKNDSILFSKGYGFADIYQEKAVQANTSIFRMCSVSKLFTWTAVMQLYEKGMLDLDVDVNTYLTSFKIPSSYSKPITIKHLMSHTAGFEDLVIRMTARTPDELMDLETFCKNNVPERIYPPGEIFAYSNYGVTLAGYIVEKVSGLEFNEYVMENIFKPLGMFSSSFSQPLPSYLNQDLAVGYPSINEDGRFEVGDFIYYQVGPAAGMSSTASDMGKFLMAHIQSGKYENSRILSNSTANTMYTTSHSADPRVNGFAYGWMERTCNGFRLLYHHGSSNSFSCLALFSRDHGFGIFVSYNGLNGQTARWNLMNAFMDRYYPRLESSRTDLQPLSNAEERITRFVGNYRDPRFPYSSCMKVLGLVNLVPYNTYPVTQNGSRIIVFGREFIEVEPYVFFPVDENSTIIDDDFFLIFLEDYGTKGKSYFVTNQGYWIEKLEWFEEPLLHLCIILICLGSMSCFSLVFAFSMTREKKKQKTGDNIKNKDILIENSTLKWILKNNTSFTIIGTMITLFFFLSFALLLISLNWTIFTEISWGFSIAPIIYLLFSTPIIAIFIVIANTLLLGVSWKLKPIDVKIGVFYLGFLVSCMIYVLELNFWNLLGFKF